MSRKKGGEIEEELRRKWDDGEGREGELELKKKLLGSTSSEEKIGN